MHVVLYIGMFLFCVFVPLSLITAIILQKRYYDYLQENHPEKWGELTTIWGIGPGMKNSYRGLKFLFSQNDLGDTKLNAMKASVRNAFIYFFTGSIGIFIILAIIANISAS